MQNQHNNNNNNMKREFKTKKKPIRFTKNVKTEKEQS